MVAPFDAMNFRRTLGQLPTGVTVITTTRPSGEPVGMACNSFTSVSLTPPLVMFCAANTSSTLVDFRTSGRFCVNILGSDQDAVCRRFALKGVDRFADVRWTASTAGPRLADALAWMSCSIEVEHPAGDHVIIIARVDDLRVNEDEPAPLVFHRGRYGSFGEGSTRKPPRFRSGRAATPSAVAATVGWAP
ncbi:flavin reductase family protein [Micromonospora sp. NBS 11-29]|uniref:flavin reductase family protein n=1 Tax=Micromonospora sp. NBS 11-29 TaxID=1960879 RepID=UPI000B77B232|nr:flavin reductase family protein [Micromonospora sp. NBS 11-29]